MLRGSRGTQKLWNLFSHNSKYFPNQPPPFAFQNRGVKISGSEVKTGNIIERAGRLYEILKAQHTQSGRGGATIQVEMRDLEKGLKTTERLRTTESVERVQLESKKFTYLYEVDDVIYVMNPETFEQTELDKQIFGKKAAYLTDGMQVTVGFHDGNALSGIIPTRVNCKIVEADATMKGESASSQFKKLKLENGRTIMGPTFLNAGDTIVVNTLDETYLSRGGKD